MYTASPTQLRSERLHAKPHGYADTPHIPPKLSAKEQEILKWCAMGKSSWEIGRILNCSEAGVNYHFCNIRRKFGVSSRWLALVKALEMGMIHLEGEAELHLTVAQINR
ncbi:helix-turn-helix transcriptional regulator [Pseudomonas jessenii]|jgi:DNA-binding CsgD family transcriptional regulator|uniref:Helix-turn-helix transcriptional regulator n=1 Tax=Pseudomonas jessenii TaxID=77298 RepID=A0A2W0F254_PSEJE|nr:helix-turn-helix domain-containing protein [Pseudomonas jessenii]PYY71468.1 helix-turn-helix transcriptional regulator [Pseudomonas jessenii]